jgi:hypothetical protein
VKVPVAVVGTVMVAVLPVDTMVWLVPPLRVYVKVYGAVPLAPVKVITGAVPFWQTAALPAIVPVGRGLTVIITLPV